MLKVLQTFFDGDSHQLYIAGLEIADDPALAYALKRGLVQKIEEEKPAAETKKPEPKKTTKKATNKSTKKQGKNP